MILTLGFLFQKLTSDFSLFELVREMRKQRVAMVQTVDQYILVHRAVRELFLEQMRVIDAHPYENIDDDGNPLCKNPDEVIPEYETIFVKSEEDIEKILSQKMGQGQKPVMGTAMLSRDRSPVNSKPSNAAADEDQSPPRPPPKQRNIIDSSAINTRKIRIDKENFNSAGNLNPTENLTSRSVDNLKLFEPAKAPEFSSDVPAQRFKKGNLRLSKTEDGAW